jgi:hypothetical protein
MNPHAIASAAIWKNLRFHAQHSSPDGWHVQTFNFASQIGVPERYVREALVALKSVGLVTLKTWSNSAWRQVSFSECPTENFFYNRDDANYVRVKPLWSL